MHNTGRRRGVAGWELLAVGLVSGGLCWSVCAYQTGPAHPPTDPASRSGGALTGCHSEDVRPDPAEDPLENLKDELADQAKDWGKGQLERAEQPKPPARGTTAVAPTKPAVPAGARFSGPLPTSSPSQSPLFDPRVTGHLEPLPAAKPRVFPPLSLSRSPASAVKRSLLKVR